MIRLVKFLVELVSDLAVYSGELVVTAVTGYRHQYSYEKHKFVRV